MHIYTYIYMYIYTCIYIRKDLISRLQLIFPSAKRPITHDCLPINFYPPPNPPYPLLLSVVLQ